MSAQKSRKQDLRVRRLKNVSTRSEMSSLTGEKQGFSFQTRQAHSTGKNIERLIDSDCTSHVKDAELFSDLNVSKMGKVQFANGSKSSIE